MLHGRILYGFLALAGCTVVTIAGAQEVRSGATLTPGEASAVPGGATGPGGVAPLYTVVDGNKVDDATFTGWKVWRAMACDRCHGETQDGLIGPSLNKDLKTMSKADFVACVLKGRVEKGMPNFGGVESVAKNIDHLYAYLKGRSDGAIVAGHLHRIDNP